MQSGDFRPERDVLPQFGVVSDESPLLAHLGHATYFLVAQVAEDVEEDLVGEFLDGLQSREC